MQNLYLCNPKKQIDFPLTNLLLREPLYIQPMVQQSMLYFFEIQPKVPLFLQFAFDIQLMVILSFLQVVLIFSGIAQKLLPLPLTQVQYYQNSYHSFKHSFQILRYFLPKFFDSLLNFLDFGIKVTQISRI